MTLTRLLVVFLICATSGCNSSESLTQSSQQTDVDPRVAKHDDEIWTVVGDGDFSEGEQLVVMEHGTIEETGEHWASDTYGLKIRNGERTRYLLWQDSPVNPFKLKRGDEFRFSDTIEDRFYDAKHEGYHASAEDIRIMPN